MGVAGDATTSVAEVRVVAASVTVAAIPATPVSVAPPPPPPPPAAIPGAYAAGYPNGGAYQAGAYQQGPYAGYPNGYPQGAYPGYPGYAGQPMYYAAAGTHHHIAQLNFMEGLRSRIQSMASTESLEGFSLKEMFSEVFKKRGSDAVEDYILVGTSKTTPPIELVETGWPKPWLFFRLLAALALACVALILMFDWTGNTNCIPGMMFLGAFAVPLATLVLFFELNSPHNVSIHVVWKLFLLGAVVSLGVALLGYAFKIFQLSDMEAGIVEECAKLITVVLVMRSVRYKYILNGILFGATVGAGFAAFETAGYALNVGYMTGYLQVVAQAGSLSDQVQTLATHAGVTSMISLLQLRGIEAPLGHVAWTALSAGAFWRVKKDRPFSPAMLFDVNFLKAFAIPVAMHAIWDAPWQLPFQGNQILTGLVTWYVVFGLVQQGLRQVKEEQVSRLKSTLQDVQATLTPGAAMVR